MNQAKHARFKEGAASRSAKGNLLPGAEKEGNTASSRPRARAAMADFWRQLLKPQSLTNPAPMRAAGDEADELRRVSPEHTSSDRERAWRSAALMLGSGGSGGRGASSGSGGGVSGPTCCYFSFLKGRRERGIRRSV